MTAFEGLRGGEAPMIAGFWLKELAAGMPKFDDPLCTQVGVYPDLFFPEDGRPGTAAKKICGGCSDRAACAEWALTTGEEFGVWGGMSHGERQAEARRRGIVVVRRTSHAGEPRRYSDKTRAAMTARGRALHVRDMAREHGAGVPPHRCRRPECVEANAAWKAAYNARRTARNRVARQEFAHTQAVIDGETP